MRILRAGFVLMLLSIPVLAQPPGGDFGGSSFIIGGKGGGRGGMPGGMQMMMSANPDDLFNQFSKGKDVIRRDDLDPIGQMMFDRAAKQMGVTNGQVTREQFKGAFSQMQNRGPGAFGGGGGAPNAEMQDRFAEQRFRSYDKNNDGLLSSDEMPDALKNEREKFDTNKDGFIDLPEFKVYFKSRFEQRGERPDVAMPGQEQPNVSTLPSQEQDFDLKRPVVYRAGHLPQGLPDWFKQLDIDVDGQIGLYEWVKGSKTVSEFRDMDYNDDGFLTAEEVMRFARGGKPAPPVVVTSSPTAVADGMRSMIFNGGGGPGQRNGGGGRPGGGGDTNTNNAPVGNNWNRWMGMGGDRAKAFGKEGGKEGPRRGGNERPKGERNKDGNSN